MYQKIKIGIYTPDVEDNEFKPLIDKIIDSNQSWLINGPPGAGKTTLINMIKEKLTEDDNYINVYRRQIQRHY